MASFSAGFVAFVVGTALTLALPVLAVWFLFKVFQGLFFVVGGTGRLVGRGARHVGRFVQGEIMDSLHLVGALLTATVILPLSLANVAILRFSAARHYARAFEDEFTSALLSLYRIGLGHPIRLLGLGVLTDGLERRLPELVARAPRTAPAIPARRGRASLASVAGFEGYQVLEEMPPGGSGARLFLARPTAAKASELATRGHRDPGQVVIKAFDRGFGSTLPQIVRESRALEAAKRLGHVLEHELSGEQFHYVMPFVPGDDLDVVTRRLHASAGERGLDRRSLAKVVGYASDLCATLERFHGEGLWHKDVKPSNLLVSADRLQLVDLGLVTPLASAMTLTTHGTEYYRDPELVRLAMRGVKVHEVDGVKFDVYSAGAVLYSMLENSFPAHGSLSRLTKPAPEALAWIVRRSMSDVSQRYSSAREMWRDLQAVQAASDPFSVRPADLPSVRSRLASDEAPDFAAPPHPTVPPIAAMPAAAAAPLSGRALRRHVRAQAREAAQSDRALKAARRVTARAARRSRHRGVLGALVAAAAFFAIVGGGTTTYLGAHRAAHRADRPPAVPRAEVARFERRSVPTQQVPVVETMETGQSVAPASRHRTALLLLEPEARRRPEVVRQFVDSMEADGFRVVGLDDDPTSVALEAEARRRMGAGAPGLVTLARVAHAPFDPPVERVYWVHRDAERSDTFPLTFVDVSPADGKPRAAGLKHTGVRPGTVFAGPYGAREGVASH